jgi:hypothetical protein
MQRWPVGIFDPGKQMSIQTVRLLAEDLGCSYRISGLSQIFVDVCERTGSRNARRGLLNINELVLV